MSGAAADLLERLCRLVPGIAGYQKREKRRESDKAVRERAAGLLRARRELLQRHLAGRTSGGAAALRELGPLQELLSRMERVEDSLRYAAYGYAGFFSQATVREKELAALLEYDLGLLEAAEALPVPREGETPSREEIVRVLDRMEEALARRLKAMEEAG